MRKLLCAALLSALILCACPAARADMSENMQIVYDYITETLGYNRAAACGIMSNIQYESNFRPNAIGDSGSAYGICQWNSRRQSLINYCERNGFESWQDIYGQLGYLGYELENNKKKVGDYLREVPDTPRGVYQAAYYFCVYFEIPANRYEKGVRRGSTAVTKYYKMYGGVYETYSVRFNLGGGMGSFTTAKKIEGVPLVLSGDEPLRYGYEFVGWCLDAFSNRVDLSPGEQYTCDADATLYALWRVSSSEDFTFSGGDSGLEVVAYHGEESKVSIPSQVGGEPVCAIRSGAFGAVSAVYIPESVSRIEDGAFAEGTLIAALPDSFAHAYAMEHGFPFAPAFPEDTLCLGENVRVIEAEAFSMTDAVYADLSRSAVTRIESRAFAGAQRLRLVSLPDSVSFIAGDAFEKTVAIMAGEGSYAHGFALENGYRFIPIN